MKIIVACLGLGSVFYFTSLWLSTNDLERKVNGLLSIFYFLVCIGFMLAELFKDRDKQSKEN
jgi:hypothetical protein